MKFIFLLILLSPFCLAQFDISDPIYTPFDSGLRGIPQEPEPWKISSGDVYCEIPTDFDYSIIGLSPIVLGPGCVTPIPEIPDEDDLRDRMSDLSRCDCIERDRLSVAAVSAQGENPRPTEVTSLNMNISSLNAVLEAEQNGMRFHALTLTETRSQGELAVAAFTVEHDINQDLRQVRDGLADRRRRRGQSMEGVKELRIESPDDRLLDRANMPPGYCVSMKAFLAAKQVPDDNAFYADLAGMESFVPEDWDYAKVRDRFKRYAGSFLDIQDALARPEIKKLYLRMNFLHHNPLIKNFFSATSKAPELLEKKRELFGQMRSIFSTDDNCGSMDGVAACSSRMDNKDAFKNFRQLTREFFGANPLIGDQNLLAHTQDGAKHNIESHISEAEKRLETAVERAPAILWAEAVSSYLNANPDTDFMADLRGNYGVYAHYCPLLKASQEASRFRTLSQLDDELGSSFTSDPYRNRAYRELNERLCQANRSLMDDGRSINFEQFRREECGSSPRAHCAPGQENELLRQWIRASSGTPHEPIDDILASVLPEVDKMTVMDSESLNRANTLAGDRLYFRSNEFRNQFSLTGSGDSQISRSATISRTQLPSGTASSTPSPRTPASTLALPEIGPVSALGAPFVPVTPQTATSVPVTPQTLTREIERSDSGLSGLRDELSGLNRELQAERAKADSQRSDQLIRDLTARIDSLSRRIETETQNNEALRQQFALAQIGDRQTRTPERAQVVPDSSGLRSGTFTASPGLSQGPEGSLSQSVPGQVSSGSLPRLGSQAPGATNSGSLNRALLGRSASAGQDRSGSIVVSRATPTEYLNLLSQTAGNEVEATVPLDVYNQIAQGDTSSLQERVRSCLPETTGQVRRCEIRTEGSEQEIEILVQKAGENDFRITFGNGGPAPAEQIRAPAGGGLLDQLNQELRQGR